MNKEERWLLEEKYFGKKNKEFFKDLERLKNGEPLAFIIGWVDCLNTKIDLEYKALIPRTETEFWVWEFLFPEIEQILASPKSALSKLKILDLFAGSGCIGIGILNKFKNKIELDFGEIDKNYLKQIEKNLKINNLNTRELIQTNIFQNISKKYDLIITNPPYISKEKEKSVQKSVLKYEDKKALFAEDKGLFFVKKIIDEGKKYLKKEGQIWIEYDHWQTELIKNYLKEKKINNFKIYKDQFGRDRVVQIIFE